MPSSNAVHAFMHACEAHAPQLTASVVSTMSSGGDTLNLKARVLDVMHYVLMLVM